MHDQWRFTATAITRYDPAFRNEAGHYKKDDWLGFFQVGSMLNGSVLSFEEYVAAEEKYIKAAAAFLQFHSCTKFCIKHLELYSFGDYNHPDLPVLTAANDTIGEGFVADQDMLPVLVQLILREIIWCELFCDEPGNTAIRFGYDMYMYFNAERGMTDLFAEVRRIGLYVS